MNSVVTGLVWSARKANGLSELTFLGCLGKSQMCHKGVNHFFLWTTFLANWPEPFRQHDVTDFVHHLLQLLNPHFFSCCWEPRLEEESGGSKRPGVLLALVHLR